ncbi:MAG: hypothetical protein ACTSYI_16545 [Promethearchaeota archaeon]
MISSPKSDDSLTSLEADSPMKRRIMIRCPNCGEVFRHKITPEMRLQQSRASGGLIPIFIKFFKCDHKVIVYLDRYYMARGFILVENEEDIPRLLKVENPTKFPIKLYDLWGKCVLVC